MITVDIEISELSERERRQVVEAIEENFPFGYSDHTLAHNLGDDTRILVELAQYDLSIEQEKYLNTCEYVREYNTRECRLHEKKHSLDPQHIIQFKHGTLYLKLHEDFDTSRMEIHATLAEITRTAVKIVKADSKGEVSSTSMTLHAPEWVRLAEGVEMVRAFWEESPLPHKHVLLYCGCVLDWDVFNSMYHEEAYLMPHDGLATYCIDHEDTRIYRLNISDFVDEDEPVAESDGLSNVPLDEYLMS